MTARFYHEFCRMGYLFTTQDGRHLQELLAARHDADYHDVPFDAKKAARLMSRARVLYSRIQAAIEGATP